MASTSSLLLGIVVVVAGVVISRAVSTSSQTTGSTPTNADASEATSAKKAKRKKPKSSKASTPLASDVSRSATPVPAPIVEKQPVAPTLPKKIKGKGAQQLSVDDMLPKDEQIETAARVVKVVAEKKQEPLHRATLAPEPPTMNGERVEVDQWERYEPEPEWEEVGAKPKKVPHQTSAPAQTFAAPKTASSQPVPGSTGGQTAKNAKARAKAAAIKDNEEQDRIARLNAHRAARAEDEAAQRAKAARPTPHSVSVQATQLNGDDNDYWRQSPVSKPPSAGRGAQDGLIWS